MGTAPCSVPEYSVVQVLGFKGPIPELRLEGLAVPLAITH